MQIFPSDPVNRQMEEQAVKKIASQEAEKPVVFAGMLANFIEDGREEYGGRPSGFSAQEKGSGTLSNREAELFIKALRERNVDEENLAALEGLMQKGQGLTIGSAFRAVAGKGERASEALNDRERDAFKALLGKMGLSRDQVDDMVALSDGGESTRLLASLRQTLGNMDGAVDATREEFASVLRSLDLSDSARNKIMHLFGDQEGLSLTGPEMQALLVEAGRDFARRAVNSRHAGQQLRTAMNDALAASKAEALAGQVDDMRGNRRSEQLKVIMDDTVMSRTGAYEIKQDMAGEEEAFARGRTRQGVFRAGQEENSQGRAASKLLENVGTAGEFGIAQDSRMQARNLDMAGRAVDREIFSQVEQGILQSLRNGAQKLTLQLMPEDLGRLNLVLSLKQGELKAVITAENADSAALLNDQMGELKAALEEQGITVAELEVQVGLRDNSLAGQWNGSREHNEMTDARERDRAMRLARSRREESGLDDASSMHRAGLAVSHGLHIVA